ncbi:MAG: hypothetical protein WB683_15330 [Candidatus Sulfotelmatobacter sp.]
MALIHVPRPENAWNPNRPVNALLKAQITHLHDAELKLPARQQTDIYINAIKTEGEAADYVRQVTEAIQAAHQAAAAKRARPAPVNKTKKSKAKKTAAPNARRKT